MKSLKTVKEELLKNEDFRREYYKRDKDFEIAKEVMRVRIAHGLTQEELARRIKTKQPSIARLEGGDHTPSLKILRAIEEALGIDLVVKYSSMSNIRISSTPQSGVVDTIMMDKSFISTMARESA